MLLISWNVAGWSSTSAAIRESYGSIASFFDLTGADIICIQECKGTWAKLEADPTAMGASDPPAKKRKSVAPVAPFHVRGGAPAGLRAAQAPAPAKQGPPPTGGIEGWESFWSLSSPKHRGFNGVVTFARSGLTWRCDNAPFNVPELDDEGRVVVTHHSAFVLVNVYVPNARGGERAGFKYQFLESLRCKMDQLRVETGKPVILAGDLNMTYRPDDGAWMLRQIHLKQLVDLQAACANGQASSSSSGPGKATATVGWDSQCPFLPRSTMTHLCNAVAHALGRRLATIVEEVKQAVPAASPPSRTASSGGLNVLSAAKEEPSTGVVSVDAPVEAAGGGTLDLPLAEQLLERLSSHRCEGADSGLASAPSPVSLGEYYKCGLRSLSVEELIIPTQTAHNRSVFALARLCGLPPHGRDSVRFMSSLLHEDHWRFDVDADEDGVPPPLRRSQTRMWDSFLLSDDAVAQCGRPRERQDDCGRDSAAATAQPLPNDRYCPCPFTCWDQSRNKRSSNEGTRLDYILVDTALVPFVVPRTGTANNTGFTLLPSRETPPTVSSPASAVPAIAVDLVASPTASPTGSPLERSEDPSSHCHFGEFAGAVRVDGIRRAMADGLYPPAPYDRSGLPPLEDGARGSAFCGLPSTGLFVTPPQFSDHIGVALQFKSGSQAGGMELRPRPGKLVEDHGKCMYRPPVGLHSFFMKMAPKAAAAATTGAPQDAVPPAKRAKAEDSGPSVIDVDDVEG